RINTKPPPYLMLGQKILGKCVLGCFVARNFLLRACERNPEHGSNQSHGYESVGFRLSPHGIVLSEFRQPPRRDIAQNNLHHCQSSGARVPISSECISIYFCWRPRDNVIGEIASSTIRA